MFNLKNINKNFIMTSSELKDLVKAHFNLTEVVEAVENEVNETFGRLKDVNGAFEIEFPGDSLQVGDKVEVVTAEDQKMAAPDGTHELEDGTKIVTKDSVVESIEGAGGEKALAEQDDEEKVEMAEEEIIEEEKMEEEVKVEDIVEAIVSEVKDEMRAMKEKMEAIEEKVAMMEDAPAAEPTMTSTGKREEASSKFSKFNVLEARNADRIQMALKAIKNKK